jgi:SAM-dependent methyltransferase
MSSQPVSAEAKAEEVNQRATANGSSQHPGYLLDNAAREAPGRLVSLSALFDPGTIRLLQERKVTRNWRCLEVGAGNGSIARWLANEVGPAGYVLATDIDPRFLESSKRPNLEVCRHDIVNDPIPEGAFDLVHCRLVLRLLDRSQRERALTHMISALKPGGWLVDEDLDTASMPPDPIGSPGEVRLETQMAMMRYFQDRGVDMGFGRLLFAHLRAQQLLNIGAEGRVFMCPGGSPGADILRACYQQLRTVMIDGGYLRRQQFEQDVASLDNPDFLAPTGILWAAWGQRR